MPTITVLLSRLDFALLNNLFLTNILRDYRRAVIFVSCCLLSKSHLSVAALVFGGIAWVSGGVIQPQHMRAEAEEVWMVKLSTISSPPVSAHGWKRDEFSRVVERLRGEVYTSTLVPISNTRVGGILKKSAALVALRRISVYKRSRQSAMPGSLLG